MTNQHNINPSDRRSGNERRVYIVDIGFPFVDTHGHLVVNERRKLADRREAYSEYHEEQLSLDKLSEQTA